MLPFGQARFFFIELYGLLEFLYLFEEIMIIKFSLYHYTCSIIIFY